MPGSLAACYYAQRASAALIVSEATQVSMQGQGYAWTPGIHCREQVEAWRRITDAVHQTAGLMFCQLWHVGRISHPALQPDNMLPVAPSAIIPAGRLWRHSGKPHPLAVRTRRIPDAGLGTALELVKWPLFVLRTSTSSRFAGRRLTNVNAIGGNPMKMP